MSYLTTTYTASPPPCGLDREEELVTLEVIEEEYWVHESDPRNMCTIRKCAPVKEE